MSRLSDLLTVSEAAELKGVLPRTVRRRIERGRLPAVKKGTLWLIRRKDLDEWNVRKRGGLDGLESATSGYVQPVEGEEP